MNKEKNKRVWEFIGLAIIIVAIVSAVYGNIKQNKKAGCESFSLDACPAGCVICPPCPECSSVACMTEDFCKANGIGKDWYETMQKRINAISGGPIKIINISVDGKISSPVTIEGKASGTWFFEGSFPVEIFDNKWSLLGSGFVTAKEDWMTEKEIEFSGSVEFQNQKEGSGWIRFKKDNPSGLPENDLSFDFPVIFSENLMTVNVYFPDRNTPDQDYSCKKVEPVAREIEKTESVASSALRELLKGPSEKEINEGFKTVIPEGSELLNLSITDGVAYADFNDILNKTGGSCAVGMIRSQIESTLKQFSSVKEVVISVEGNVEEALQP